MSARALVKHLDHASRAPAGTDERTRFPLVNTSHGAPSAREREEGGVGKEREVKMWKQEGTPAIEPETEDALTHLACAEAFDSGANLRECRPSAGLRGAHRCVAAWS